MGTAFERLQRSTSPFKAENPAGWLFVDRRLSQSRDLPWEELGVGWRMSIQMSQTTKNTAVEFSVNPKGMGNLPVEKGGLSKSPSQLQKPPRDKPSTPLH